MHGHEPLEADDAAAAVAIARRESPCLVLLDLGMPGADGSLYLKFRESDPGLSAIPVVLSTARIEHGLPFPTLRKPFTLADLLETIATQTRCDCARLPG